MNSECRCDSYRMGSRAFLRHPLIGRVGMRAARPGLMFQELQEVRSLHTV